MNSLEVIRLAKEVGISLAHIQLGEEGQQSPEGQLAVLHPENGIPIIQPSNPPENALQEQISPEMTEPKVGIYPSSIFESPDALKLSKIITSKYYAAGATRSDIGQVANMGMMRAIKDYRIGKGSGFWSFARLCAEREVTNFIESSHTLKHQPVNMGLSFESQNDEDKTSLHEIIATDRITDPEVIIDQKQQMNTVFHVVENDMSEMQRNCFNLVILGGKTYEEAAELTGVSVKSVDNYLCEGRVKVKKALLEGITIYRRDDLVAESQQEEKSPLEILAETMIIFRGNTFKVLSSSCMSNEEISKKHSLSEGSIGSIFSRASSETGLTSNQLTLLFYELGLLEINDATKAIIESDKEKLSEIQRECLQLYTEGVQQPRSCARIRSAQRNDSFTQTQSKLKA